MVESGWAIGGRWLECRLVGRLETGLELRRLLDILMFVRVWHWEGRMGVLVVAMVSERMVSG